MAIHRPLTVAFASALLSVRVAIGPGPYSVRRVIDRDTEFGARVARHLREDVVVWLTSVSPSGAPLPAPVWFVWDGAESVLMYSMPGARVRNLRANPKVSLNFAG